jgi:cobalamin synthase
MLRSLPKPNSMEQLVHLNLSLTPLVSLLAGIIILIVPRMLNFIVAAYLIIIGLIGLLGNGNLHLH